MSNFFDDFADSFFWAILVMVSVLSFVDWLSGEKKRGEWRDFAGDIWTYLSYHSISDIVHDGLEHASRTMSNAMEKSSMTFTIKYVSACILVLLALNALIYPFQVSIRRAPAFKRAHGVQEIETISFVVSWWDAAAPLLVLSPVIMLFSLVSLSATKFFLDKMASAENLLKICFFFVLDSILAFLAFLPSIFAVSIANAMVTGFFPIGCLSHPHQRAAELFANGDVSGAEQIIDGSNVGPLLTLESLLICFLPTLLYVGYVALLIFAKLTQPVLQPVAMLLLARFHESKKGILTNLAIFVGVSSKVLQQTLKVWG